MWQVRVSVLSNDFDVHNLRDNGTGAGLAFNCVCGRVSGCRHIKQYKSTLLHREYDRLPQTRSQHTTIHTTIHRTHLFYSIPHILTANTPSSRSMRRAFSLLALGITIALTAAAPVLPVLTLTSIKAVDSARDNKDQWSAKGYLSDPDAQVVSAIGNKGVDADLEDFATNSLDGVTFDADDCKVLLNNKGVVCKKSGARLSIRKTNRIPKDALIAAQKAHNKTSPSASSYYKVSGVFRRQDFEEDPVKAPLTAIFSIGLTALSDSMPCTTKTSASTTKYSCTPGN